MIPVNPQPEPVDFAVKISKEKAEAFLREATRPINWKNREYWRDVIPDLYDAYNHICAYSAQWIPWSTGSLTVDHFLSRYTHPELAYEWSNFRLACGRMNGRKGKYQDVMDPFTLSPDTFTLDFPTMIIKPNPALPDQLKERAVSTIKRLKLNSDDRCVKGRLEWVEAYCENGDFNQLKRYAPFIAYELERLGLVERICSMIGDPTRKTRRPRRRT